ILAVHGPVEHLPHCLGGDLLEPAPAWRAGYLCRTPNRPLLGGGRHRVDRHIHRRNPARPAGPDADAGAGRRRGDGLSRDGRHAVGLVLHCCGAVFLERRADGVSRPTVESAAVRRRLGDRLFYSGTEVLSATPTVAEGVTAWVGVIYSAPP